MKARPIMIQGTASSVGKSIITAGLCRVFKQDGYSTAPFKSQNMALNSYITKEGKEMGRAQVVQAEAAGIEPSIEMNPILLKPATDKKAQVIINGVVHKNMSAAEYHEFKPQLAQMVKATYDRLAEKNDVIVIEGAGSPAEINLREKDIVNMGMAELADAPVILVGDIDKGGVFASLVGTMMLLSEDERKRVKGVIINKFRGDLEILKPGLQMLEDLINVPVLGVLPYSKLEIDDEDSLTEKFSHIKRASDEELDIAIIKLPHISNFTDFNALEQTNGVRVRYVEKPNELGHPGLIILPGSKNTMEDLLHIRKIGMEAVIKSLHEKGVAVLGICGGFQMLGMELNDPFRTESDLFGLDGMGLLEIKTVFQEKKVTTQSEGIISSCLGLLKGLEGVKVKGYEIHMGTSEIVSNCSNISINRISAVNEIGVTGAVNKEGTVLGTYLHGIFDNALFTSGLINNLRRSLGMGEIECSTRDFVDFKEQQYDNLAKILKDNLDMERIYGILGLPAKEV